MPAGYAQAIEYIHSFDDPYLAAIRDHGHQTWGLAKIESLLAKIGDPQSAYPVIHVAGTKGKGSTSALIARALEESGLNVGLYSSPHLTDWRERIQINHQLIEQQAVVSLVEDVKPFAEAVPGLSTFEVTTALAFWYFAREKVDIAVIEVGLGGRLDATNVVDPVVSVITSISLDHMQLLGDTLTEIAGEKAAIIKQGSPVVSAPQAAEAAEVIAAKAVEMGSRLIRVGIDWRFDIIEASLSGTQVRITGPDTSEEFKVALPGLFQAENAAVAIAVLDEARKAGIRVTPEGIRTGLSATEWPGRLEVVQSNPLIVLDGAHNPYSIGRLVESLVALAPGHPIDYVFGCMADKDVEGMLRHLVLTGRTIIFTRAETGRAAEPDQLLAKAKALVEGNSQVSAQPLFAVAETVAEAIDMALPQQDDKSLLCVTGSLAIVAEGQIALAEKDQQPDRHAEAETSEMS